MSSYHHGDLAATVLTETAKIIAKDGPEALKLRSLAKQLDVSHNAFRHHFGNRQGLLNALAIEGHKLLRSALQESAAAGGDAHLEAGVSYVRFALDYPGHFTVMFRPDLLDLTDPQLNEARSATFAILSGGPESRRAAATSPQQAAVSIIASWAVVHGIATLTLTGNLEVTGLREAVADGNIEEITRLAAGSLSFEQSKEE